MSRFIPASWWPAAAVLAPVAIPACAIGFVGFQRDSARAAALNEERLGAAPLELPPVKKLEILVLVEWRAEPGFLGDPGVSYLIRTEQGSLLFDIGFGTSTPVLEHNVRKLGVDISEVSALAISHLHLDHMGGIKAQRQLRVAYPDSLGPAAGRPCFLPGEADAPEWTPRVVSGPSLLAAGLATPGPLARSLFFMGLTNELSLVARLDGLGLVVFTGCGHPGLGPILEHAVRVFGEPVHAVVGGLHLPLTASRGYGGLPVQRILGTGLPPWLVLDDQDLDGVLEAIRTHGVKRLFLSAHDSCDEGIKKIADRSGIPVRVLSAGSVIKLGAPRSASQSTRARPASRRGSGRSARREK